METRQKNVLLWALVFSCILVAQARTSASSDLADAHYQAAVEAVGRVSVEESIRAFQDVLKADPKYAPAHHQIARLYMAQQTPNDRLMARSALDKAIHLDPENLEYQLTLGELLYAQGFWENARRQYDKTLEIHPESAEAAYRIGTFFLKQFLKYRAMTAFVKSPSGGKWVKWEHFGEEAQDKAIRSLEHSIEMDPLFRTAYYQLGLIHFETNRPEKLVQVSKRLLAHVPKDKDALLFCGLGHQAMGKHQKAYEWYAQALEQMDAEERTVMESVDLICEKGKENQIVQEEQRVALAAYEHSGKWVDSPGIARFWRKQDPLFLTDFNERRMAHYGRVAYANLRFGEPNKGLAGFQTDMGRTYIRFGRYLRPMTQRADMDLPPPTGGFIYIRPHLETWVYEGFEVSFVSPNGLDEWGFATDKVFIHKIPPRLKPRSPKEDFEEPGPGFSSPMVPLSKSTTPSAVYTFNNTLPRFVDPYREAKYSMPHQVAAFQEGDRIRVELSYAFPKEKFKADAQGTVSFEDGTFIFDEKWDGVYRDVQTFQVKVPPSEKARPGDKGDFHRNYLLSQSQIILEPGHYQVVAEVKDRATESIGTFRKAQNFAFRDSAVQTSDLLLASRITTKTPFPEGREDLAITPNPLRSFHRSKQVCVYFEVYNLTRDAFGRTAYEITYEIGRPKKEEIDPGQFVPLDMMEGPRRVEIEVVSREKPLTLQGNLEEWQIPEPDVEYKVRYLLPEESGAIQQIQTVDSSEQDVARSITARYKGNRRDDLTYLQIDVTQVPVGVHRLTVMVKDHGTEKTCERNVLFRVVK